jgi:uncharacterized protein YebE (UPF0316 family)
LIAFASLWVPIATSLRSAYSEAIHILLAIIVIEISHFGFDNLLLNLTLRGGRFLSGHIFTGHFLMFTASLLTALVNINVSRRLSQLIVSMLLGCGVDKH